MLKVPAVITENISFLFTALLKGCRLQLLLSASGNGKIVSRNLRFARVPIITTFEHLCFSTSLLLSPIMI